MNTQKKSAWRHRYSGVVKYLPGMWFYLLFVAPVQGAISLEQAVALAHQNDPWLAGSEFRQQALEAKSISVGSLPDPTVSVGFFNLPTDTFDLNQEAMTQVKLGVSQVFPRGDSRDIGKKQLSLMSSQQVFLREERRAQVQVQVSQLWLEAYRARESIRLIEQDRDLFEHLVDVAQSSYSSAVGGTRQQDLVRAQLELTRLEDDLTVLHERFEASSSQLAQWLSPAADAPATVSELLLQTELPELLLLNPELCSDTASPSPEQLSVHLQRHPGIRQLDRRIAASDTGVELAEQKYRPQWRIDASYGYRDDDPLGNDRTDFFSVGVSFDLPLFTSNRQDRQVQSAVADTESLRTERSLALRNMLAQFNGYRSRLLRLEQRQQLYRSRLLQEMHEQAEASLSAYTNDDGDFAEVVRARIDELNARIDALDIDIERLKTITQINYFFADTSV